MTGIKASPQREILPCHRLHISTTGNACVDIKAVLSQEATSVWFSFLIAELPRSEAPCVENLVIYFVRAYVRLFLFGREMSYKLNTPKHIKLCLTWYWTSIIVMINWHQSYNVSADQCRMTASQAQVPNSLRWPVFKVICWLVRLFNWLQAQKTFI